MKGVLALQEPRQGRLELSARQAVWLAAAEAVLLVITDPLQGQVSDRPVDQRGKSCIRSH